MHKGWENWQSVKLDIIKQIWPQYAKPTLREKPDPIIIHVGTNDGSSPKKEEGIAEG